MIEIEITTVLDCANFCKYLNNCSNLLQALNTFAPVHASPLSGATLPSLHFNGIYSPVLFFYFFKVFNYIFPAIHSIHHPIYKC